MNKTLLEIPKELQNHYKKQVSDQLFKLKFYEEVPKSHPYRFASMDAQSLDMLEQIMVDALCIYDVFHTDFGIKTDIVKAFALFAAFRNAGFQPEITSDKTEDLFRINLSEDFTSLLFITIPIGFIDAYNNGPNYTKRFFNSICNTVYKFANVNNDSNMFDNFTLKLSSTTITGFSLSKQTSSNLKIPSTSWTDIIGNSEVKMTLKTIIDDLLCYDINKKQNPVTSVISLPTTVMIWGKPGTGKTIALRATSNYFLSKAERIGKSSHVKVLVLTTDIFSKFKGESASNLSSMFNEAMDPNGICLLYIEDIDALFPSRDELKDEPEDKQVFQALINLIRGVSTETLGNYIIVATSNKPSLLDNALLQRFNVTIKVEGPKNSEEILQLIELHLKQKSNKIKISKETLRKCSEIMFSNNLVGRDVDNIVQSFISQMIKQSRTGERTEDFYKLTFEEQTKRLVQDYTIHNQDTNFLNSVIEYSKMKEEQILRERQDRIDEIVERRKIEAAADIENKKSSKV